MAPDFATALVARGNHYRRGVPGVPARFDRMLHGDDVIAGGSPWRIICGYGHSPEHASLHSAARGLLISGDMLLPRISTNVSTAAAEPDGDPLARFLDSIAVSAMLPPEILVLPSHGLPFRGIALRVAQLQAHHSDRLAELEHAVGAAVAPVSASRRAACPVPARTRPAAALLCHGRGYRPSQPPVAPQTHQAYRCADGDIRFAT